MIRLIALVERFNVLPLRKIMIDIMKLIEMLHHILLKSITKNKK